MLLGHRDFMKKTTHRIQLPFIHEQTTHAAGGSTPAGTLAALVVLPV
jgi:hypothetical protein